MINSIQEKRVKHEKGYDLYLEVPENQYLSIYEAIDEENARDIVHQFLRYHQDDGRLQSVRISHDKGNHSVNIKALLSYEGNDHSDVTMITPDHLRR